MPDLDSILAQLERNRMEIQLELGKRIQVEKDIEVTTQRLETEQTAVTELTECIQILQILEGTWHKTFEDQLAGMISRGLSLVFGEPLTFILETKKRGDQSSMDFKLRQMVGGQPLLTDIMDAKGGGVVAVASFLLRTLVLLASKPPLAPLLVLDESFAMVSREFVPNLAHLLRQLCDETGVQILLVTHEPSFGDHADIVYEVTQNAAGESQYTRIKSHAERIAA